MTSNPHHEADTVKLEGPQYIFKPTELSIKWGKDERCWILPNKDGSPAELVQVSRLEVTGTALVKAGTKYRIGFHVEMKDNSLGWEGAPVFLMANIGKRGRKIYKRVNLAVNKNGAFDIPSETDKFELQAPNGVDDDKTLYFGLYEVWSGKQKRGLKIHHAFVQEV